ncbi:MAG: SpoIIE family protein phosphatase [Dermatophilaceae bacterium]
MTAQMARLDVGSGLLDWASAGHPAPLLLRGHRVVAELDSLTTLPVGFGGATPVVTKRALERGGVTSNDATLLLLEWRGGSGDHRAPKSDAYSAQG